MAAKQDLKARLLRTAALQGTRVDIGDGVEVLARSPSVACSMAIARAQKAGDDAKAEEALVETFMDVACDPSTGQPIFGPEDREAVLALPSGIIMRVIQAAGLAPDPKAAAKN